MKAAAGFWKPLYNEHIVISNDADEEHASERASKYFTSMAYSTDPMAGLQEEREVKPCVACISP